MMEALVFNDLTLRTHRGEVFLTSSTKQFFVHGNAFSIYVKQCPSAPNINRKYWSQNDHLLWHLYMYLGDVENKYWPEIVYYHLSL